MHRDREACAAYRGWLLLLDRAGAGRGLLLRLRRRVVADRVVELDEPAVDRTDQTADERRPLRRLARDLEAWIPHLREQRVQTAADAESEQGFEHRDPVRRALVSQHGPQRFADKQTDQRAHEAERQPRIAKSRRHRELVCAVPDGATDHRTLEQSDEELDHRSSMMAKRAVGKAERSSRVGAQLSRGCALRRYTVRVRELELEALDAPIARPLDAEGLIRADCPNIEDSGEGANDLVGLRRGQAAALEELAERVGLRDLALYVRDGRCRRRHRRVAAGGRGRRRRKWDSRQRHRRARVSLGLPFDRADAGVLVPDEHVEVDEDERPEEEHQPRATSLGGCGSQRWVGCPFLAPSRSSTDHGCSRGRGLSRLSRADQVMANQPPVDLPPREQLELFCQPRQGAFSSVIEQDMAKKSETPKKKAAKASGGGKGRGGGISTTHSASSRRVRCPMCATASSRCSAAFSTRCSTTSTCGPTRSTARAQRSSVP